MFFLFYSFFRIHLYFSVINTLSIVFFGLQHFDDHIPQRRFDNFQFVEFYRTVANAENREVAFTVAALQEIPDQYLEIKRLGLL
jgi:hypothetical protein